MVCASIVADFHYHLFSIRQWRTGVLLEVPPVFAEPMEFKGVPSDRLETYVFTCIYVLLF